MTPRELNSEKILNSESVSLPPLQLEGSGNKVSFEDVVT